MTHKANQSESYKARRRVRRAKYRRDKRAYERNVKETFREYETDRYKRKIQRHIFYCKVAIVLCSWLPFCICKAIEILFIS